MKIYIAGPMSNIPHFNYPAFHAAADRLRAQGHVVFSPAEMDILKLGKDISGDNPTGSIEQAVRDHGFDRKMALWRDVEQIFWAKSSMLDQSPGVDAIAMLPKWENSRGAIFERSGGSALGIELRYL